ncbi:LysR family transcriptional regulator [Alkalihalobacillus sp. BA299]|uniref:LysR family transcriptional regulator n=1 Tax=Alkalihalobacillus sp. BA299 TaxID=2815938 RepID=UPI001ADA5009|nr:LysR family transcriptional regulator [Alkalihalobacillus sp. BA299]
MNIHQLQIFQKLVQVKSITKVANQLGLKQPTVSFHLKKLEEELGLSLYSKRADDFSLTPAGKTLYNYASEILSLVSEVDRVMKDYQSFKRGELLIGASHIPANYILPPVLSTFTEANPNIHLSLTVQSTPSIIELIKEKEIDFGVVSEQNLYDEAIAIHRIVGDELTVIFSKQHELAQKPDLTIDDFKDQAFILHKQGSTREMINGWAKQENIKLPLKMELSSIEAICTMVRMNTGISIISKRAAEFFIERGDLLAQPVPNMENNRNISLVYRKDRPITPIMQQFINSLFQQT